MGLFNKIKNVLFEEEEIEEEVTPASENNNSSTTSNPRENLFKAVDMNDDEYRPLPKKQEDVKVKEPTFEKVEPNDISERDLFRSESTFKFPAFDEEEFNTSMPRIKREEPVKEKKSEYSRLDSFRVKEEPAKEEKKRFKPSPVISPVYGILDKDYKVEDIKEAPKGTNGTILSSKDLDVESVRAKAFGKLENNLAEKSVRKSVVSNETYDIKKEEEKKEEIKKEEIEKPLFDKEKDLIISDEPILEDTHNLIEERAKTIDELLKDASDTVIDAEEELNVDDLKFDDDEIDEIINEEKPSKESLENDTLENDLYDLIDSMYDNTEEGE